MSKWLQRGLEKTKGPRDWLLFVAPFLVGWLAAGPSIALMYAMGQSTADAGKAAAALSLFAMTIIALVTRTKIKSALIYSGMSYAGFMIAMAVMLNDIPTIRAGVDVDLYKYVAIGIIAGTALPCFIVTLLQRYFPVLNHLKNRR